MVLQTITLDLMNFADTLAHNVALINLTEVRNKLLEGPWCKTL